MERLKYLEDGNKYRHERCWNAIHRATLAVVALGLVPYTVGKVASVLGWWIVLPPALGVVFACFSLAFVYGEITILEPVKEMYTSLQRQDALKEPTLDHGPVRDVRKMFNEAMKAKKRFRCFVVSFMGCLVGLGSLNCGYVLAHLHCLIAASGK